MNLEDVLEKFEGIIKNQENPNLGSYTTVEGFISRGKEVILSAARTYSTEPKEIMMTIIKSPKFVTHDHQRVMEDMLAVYGFGRKKACQKSVIKNNAMPGYDQRKRFNDKVGFWKNLGFTRNEVKDMVLHNPVLLGYSEKRELGVSDIVKRLVSEGFVVPKELVLKKISKSPYVPNTEKGILSEFNEDSELLEMPDMYNVLRAQLIRN